MTAKKDPYAGHNDEELAALPTVFREGPHLRRGHRQGHLYAFRAAEGQHRGLRT